MWPFGGPGLPFRLERSYNSDNRQAGLFGIGWSFNLGDRLTTQSDGTLTVVRGSGVTDIFAPGFASGSGYFAVTATSDTLTPNSDGSFTLATAGSKTTRIFSAKGLLMAIQNSGVTTVALTYDLSGNLMTASYRGRAVTFTNDGAGHIASFTDAAGRTASFTYTGDGHLAQQTGVDGQTVGYQYDGNGNLTGIQYAGGTVGIAWLLDPPFTSVASISTPDGSSRTYSTPQSPTQIQLTSNGNATLYTSSANGLLLAVTDPYNHTLSYSYDAVGHRTQAVDALGDTENFAYDSNGNLVSAGRDAARVTNGPPLTPPPTRRPLPIRAAMSIPSPTMLRVT